MPPPLEDLSESRSSSESVDTVASEMTWIELAELGLGFEVGLHVASK